MVSLLYGWVDAAFARPSRRDKMNKDVARPASPNARQASHTSYTCGKNHQTRSHRDILAPKLNPGFSRHQQIGMDVFSGGVQDMLPLIPINQ